MAERVVGDIAGRGPAPADPTTGITPLHASQSLEDALASFRRQHVGRLPVVGDCRLVGSVTEDEVIWSLETDAELGPSIRAVSTDISPNDRMFAIEGVRAFYLWVGASAIGCIRRSLALVDRREPRNILDFACGHGRVLRMLRAAFPDAELTACDVLEDGVKFCAETFGATGVLSHPDPARVTIDGRFDLVWSGSLFTHLDMPRWSGFFDLVESVLEPGGLFVFTVQGGHTADSWRNGVPEPQHPREAMDRILAGYDTAGFGYGDYTGMRDWGDALVRPEWVRAMIAGRDALELVDYLESGWAGAQDVVTCLHRPRGRGLATRART
jgi:SAM-dependent methyltransferase